MGKGKKRRRRRRRARPGRREERARGPRVSERVAHALAEAIGVVGVSPAVLGKRVAQHSGFLGERGVSVRREHTRGGNVITLSREGGEGCEGTPGATPLPSLPSHASPSERPAPPKQQLLPGF
jgi:hypothetical protein